MRCSPTSRPAAPRTRCRCSPSRLERLYGEYHAGGSLKLSHYEALGRVKGSIEAAVERALKAADARPGNPEGPRRTAGAASPRPHSLAGRHRSRHRRAAPPRRPAFGNPRRGTAADPAPWSSSACSRPMSTRTPARPPSSRRTRRCCGNGACCRAGSRKMPGSSPCWRASSARAAIGRRTTGAGLGLRTRPIAWRPPERLLARPDLAANLEPTDRQYLAACRKAEADAKRGWRLLQAAIYVLFIGVIAGLVGWINQAYIKRSSGAGIRVNDHSQPRISGLTCSQPRQSRRSRSDDSLQGMLAEGTG